MIRAYTRARVEGRAWHKIVLDMKPEDKPNAAVPWGYDVYEKAKQGFQKRINEVLEHCHGDVLIRNGGHFKVMWVESDDDMVWLIMKLGLTDYELRGKGDWSKAKYNDAASNRMVDGKIVRNYKIPSRRK
jgi:hypothetical protein